MHNYSSCIELIIPGKSSFHPFDDRLSCGVVNPMLTYRMPTGDSIAMRGTALLSNRKKLETS